ncbi:hypothetical protein PSAC2689_10178 [Paraburkholderia sacchari]
MHELDTRKLEHTEHRERAAKAFERTLQLACFVWLCSIDLSDRALAEPGEHAFLEASEGLFALCRFNVFLALIHPCERNYLKRIRSGRLYSALSFCCFSAGFVSRTAKSARAIRPHAAAAPTA